MNKAIFLDRDGTINIDKKYMYRIDEFEYIPLAVKGLKLLQDAGYMLFILTNQSGIARGYYTEEDFFRLNEWMLRDLQEKGINISKVYYCPHHPSAIIAEYRRKCICRKPSLGMFMQAINEYEIDISNSYTIGDKLRDSAICFDNICSGYLISNNENRDIIDAVKLGNYSNVRYKRNLYEAAMEIVHRREKR